MAYGDNLAGSFRLPQTQSPVSPADVINQGRLAEQELIGQGGAYVPEAPSGLQMVQGQTEEIYKKWGDLKNYADTMWHNYRINVQRPDLRDESAVRASEAYKKALASLQYSVANLKEGQRRQTLYDNAYLEGKGAYLVDPSQQSLANVNPEEAFMQTQALQQQAQSSNQAYAKSYDTRSATKAAGEGVQRNKDYFESIKNKLTNQGAAGAADKVNQIQQSLQGPVHEAPVFAPRADSGKKGPDPAMVIDELVTIRDMLYNNDQSGISWLKSAADVSDVVRTSNGVRVTANGKTYNIDFNGPYGGLETINEMRGDSMPSGDQLPTRNLLPYFKMGLGQGYLPDEDPSTPQLSRLKVISQNMYTGSEGVDSAQRENFMNKLDQAISNKQLRTVGGELIDSISVDEDDETPIYTISIFGGKDGVDKEVVFDLSTASGKRSWEEFINNNAGSLVDWSLVPKVQMPTPLAMPGSTMKSGMSKQEFQDFLMKQGNNGQKFDVNAFKKANSK